MSQEPSHYATENGHIAVSASEMKALGLNPSGYIPLFKDPINRPWKELSDQEVIDIGVKHSSESCNARVFTEIEYLEQAKAISEAIRLKNQ